MTKIRRGSDLLQFIIAGSGNRPSRLTFGGASVAVGLGTDGCRKSPDLEVVSSLGANWCCRLANDSRRFCGPRDGSMGRNRKRVRFGDVSNKKKSSSKRETRGIRCLKTIKPLTYCPEVFLVECWALHSSLDKIGNLCLTG